LAADNAPWKFLVLRKKPEELVGTVDAELTGVFETIQNQLA
jgi:hypothetical protein